jgi:hypothetical protein
MLDFILRYFYIYNTKQNYQKKGQHQFFFGMNQQKKHNGTTKQFFQKAYKMMHCINVLYLYMFWFV